MPLYIAYNPVRNIQLLITGKEQPKTYYSPYIHKSLKDGSLKYEKD